MAERAHEVVLFGATGFTGRLCAEYLAGLADPPRWAIAGRDRGKLAALQGTLRPRTPAGAPELIVADTGDPASLAAMAASAKVVISAVGPYAKRGAPVVAACLAAGTHYCDLAGEVPWIRAMIDAHHEEARARGVRLVTCCGFDSVPSDLGVLALQSHARAQLGRACDRVTAYFQLSGGMSGGTIASMLAIAEAVADDGSIRRLLVDPYALVPEPGLRGPDRGEQHGPGYAAILDRPTAPFVMAAINARIVRRSHALLEQPWGAGFRYDECMTLGRGAKSRVLGAAISAGVPLFFGAMMVPTLRKLVAPRLPQPGEGPSDEARARGRFVVRLVGELDGAPAVFARVADDRDPGYGSTAVMLCEAALCLSDDPLLSPGGVTTPAAAMGHHLIGRLRAAGLTLEASTDRALLA
jgi:short subunit dehydrogenase-like uncharacterized protein